jgi:hypothetical protein
MSDAEQTKTRINDNFSSEVRCFATLAPKRLNSDLA